MQPTFQVQDYAAPSSSSPARSGAPALPRRLRRMLSLEEIAAAARAYQPGPL